MLMERGRRDTPSGDAELGTIKHEVVAAHLSLGNPGPIEADDRLEDLEAVNYCLDFARTVVKSAPAHALQRIEYAVDCSFIHPLIGTGTIDWALVIPFEVAYIIDWKFGYGDVEEAKNNYQLLGYACAFARAFDLEKVGVVLVKGADKKTSRVDYTREQLFKAEEFLAEKVELCKSDVARLNPVEAACRYCTARADCPALQSAAKSFPVKIDPGQLSASQIGKLLHAADTVETFIGALKQRAYEILAAGGSIEGWNLAPGRSHRKWINETEAQKDELENRLLELCALKNIDPKLLYTQPELISPAEAEKLFGKAKKIKEITDTLFVKIPGALKLSPMKGNDTCLDTLTKKEHTPDGSQAGQ